MAELLAMSAFAAGYLVITLEHRLFLNKAASSLLLAVLLWAIAGVGLSGEIVQESLVHIGSDIFSLVIFLLASMTMIEILVHYHLFDVLEKWLRSRGWTIYQLGWGIATLTFFLSAVLDNLTATIVMIQIARRLFVKRDLLLVATLLIIASNAGGAFSPIGDVTTLMLWFARKFSTLEIIWAGILPSMVMVVVSGWLLLRPLDRKKIIGEDCVNGVFYPSRSDKGIMILTLGSFLFPLVMTPLQLPPYMGRLLGLGLVWVAIDFAKRARPQETHLGANIRKFLQQTDIESLQFFVGILLSVGALHALGVLDWLTQTILGQAPSWGRLVGSFVGLGLASAVMDNVPLTAAAISALEGIPSSLWTLLAITVGTGGSLLIIGSAAGVITMGMVRQLTFGQYLKIGSWPALLGFSVAILVWMAQYRLFF